MADGVVRTGVASRLPFLNIALFFATVCTTVLAGAQQSLRAPIPATALAAAWEILVAGLPFATAIIAILLSHEMGHYVAARLYGVDSTLPFFIPVPVGPVGTFGAVIRIRSMLPSRRATLDIGAAGPFAGFAVAVPLLAWGFAHSEVHAIGDVAISSGPVGLLHVVRALWSGESLGGTSGLQQYGDSVVTWAVQRLVVGPLPPGTDVFIHPVAFAAWIGLFVTTLNLIPIGQLDGGHVTYALLGRRGARIFSRVVSLALLAAGVFVSWNWFVWWAITRFFVGYGHPAALEEEPLSPGRRAFAIAALVLFVLTFIPIPFSL